MIKSDELNFRVHTPNLLKEITDFSSSNGLPGIFFIPINQFRILLLKVAERAAELNDPILNKCMFDLALYDNCEPNNPNYIGPKIRSDYRKYIKQQKTK